jgi:hypothetical protein
MKLSCPIGTLDRELFDMPNLMICLMLIPSGFGEPKLSSYN